MAHGDLNATEQYEILTTGCGLVDRSERGKLTLTGGDAVQFLEGQVTNELSGLHSGEGRYAAFLTHKGKMLGDLRILAVGSEADPAVIDLLLDTERVALQALFDMIRRFSIGHQVELHKRTLESGLISLIGPMTPQVLASATEGESIGLDEPENAHICASIAERSVRLISTAQPDGVDVLCERDDLDAVIAALEDHGARTVSERVAEIVRVEHGRPRYGIDIDESTIPQEAGLNERAVSFTKGCYVGQETVARLYYKGKPNRHLRGLKLSSSAATGEELQLDGRVVGKLASTVTSPRFGPIGLALIRREATPGTLITVGEEHSSAEVIELPFLSKGAL